MGLSNYLPNSRIAQAGVCTSSTRPASPYEGQVIYETDTDRTLVWDGSAWAEYAMSSGTNALGQWTSWTPQLWSASTQATTSTATGRYSVIGDIAILHVVMNASGNGGNGVVECRNVPSAIAPSRTGGANNSSGAEVGTGVFLDAGTALYIGAAYFTSATAIRILLNTSVDLSLTVASGDRFICTLMYERA